MRDLRNGDLGSLNSKSSPTDSARNQNPQAGPVTETKNDLDELVSDFLGELNRLSSAQELARKEPVRTAEFITGPEGGELVEYPTPIGNQSGVPLSSETAEEVLNLQAVRIREEAPPPLFQYASDRQVKNRWIRPIGWLLVLGTLVVGFIAVYSIHFRKWKLIMGKPAGVAMPPPVVAMSPPKPSLATSPVIAAENRPTGASPAVSTAAEVPPSKPAGPTRTQAGDRTQSSATVRSKQAGQTRPAAASGSAITRSRGSGVESNRPAETPAATQHASSPTMPAAAGRDAAPQAVPPLSSTNPAPANPGNAIATVVPGNPPPEPGTSAKPPTVPSTAPAAVEERPAVPATSTRSLPADLSKGGEPPVAVYRAPTPAVVAKKVTPTYPSAAKSLGIRKVELDVDVNEAGQVVNAVALSGPPILRTPSEEALRKWQFIPATRNGVNTKSTVKVTIMFTP